MLRAPLAGERDAEVLAELAKGRLRKKLPELRLALRGRFNEHHALLVGLAMDHLEHLEAAIAKLDAEMDTVMDPFVVARDLLDTIPGVAKRAAEVIIAEIGADMSVFPTPGHLASWAGVCPGNNITGGKRHSGGPTEGDRWLGEILNQCAWSAARTRDTYPQQKPTQPSRQHAVLDTHDSFSFQVHGHRLDVATVGVRGVLDRETVHQILDDADRLLAHLVE